jgi:hypothetical protein
LVIIGGKITDQYYVDAEVKSTFRQKGDKVRFVIDPSETSTLISIPDATKNNIDYSTFEKGKFEISGTEIQAYIYPNCKLSLYHNDGIPYEISLEKVLIPVEHSFKDQIKANTSRVGSDFLKLFKISYKPSQDGDMIILEPIS